MWARVWHVLGGSVSMYSCRYVHTYMPDKTKIAGRVDCFVERILVHSYLRCTNSVRDEVYAVRRTT